MAPRGQPRRASARSTRNANQEVDMSETLQEPSANDALAPTSNQDTTNNQSMNTTASETTTSVLLDPQAEVHPTLNVAAGSSAPRPRVKRLASMLSRGSSGAPTYPDGETRPATLKFKPKSFIRRSKEEREAVERAEAERRAARLAAEGTTSLHDRGSSYGRGRGRGGGVGEMNKWKDQRFNLSHGASGHLGGSTIQDSSTNKRFRGGYGGGGGGGRGGGVGGGSTDVAQPTSAGPRVKNESAVKREKDKDGDTIMTSSAASKRKRTKIKKEDQPAYVSSEGEFDSDGAARVDIERINLVSDDEDTDNELPPTSEVAKGKQRQKSPQPREDPLRPVRIQRQEHVERAVGVNTDASSLTSAELRRKAKERNEAGGSLFLPEEEEGGITQPTKAKGRRRQKEVEFVRDERIWKGVYEDEDDKDAVVKIKDEPKDEEDDVMILDKPVPIDRPEPMAIDENDAVPLSEARQPPITGIEDTAMKIAEIEQSHAAPEDDALEEVKEDRAGKGGHNDILYKTIPAFTQAYENLIKVFDDIHTLFEDFEATASNSKPAPATKTEDHHHENVDLDHEADIFDSIGSFIFQLPPLIPSLRDAAKKPAPEEKKPKPKPVETSKPSSSTKTNPFATAPIKEEPDVRPALDDLNPQNSIAHSYISGGLYYPSGRAGTLGIHKGGKMSAAWGGLGMEVSKGGSGLAAMPQEMMMTKFDSEVAKVEGEEWAEKVEVGKAGWGMGQMRPGFVCVPELAGLLA